MSMARRGNLDAEQQVQDVDERFFAEPLQAFVKHVRKLVNIMLCSNHVSYQPSFGTLYMGLMNVGNS